MTDSIARKILVLGASDLIGRFVTDDLRLRGFQVFGVARRFSPSQRQNASDLELPVMSMDAAALPLDMPANESATPFQPVAVADIAATIAWLAGRDTEDDAVRAVTWDLMQPQPVTFSGVIEQYRWSSARLASRGSRYRRSCLISAPNSATSPIAWAGCRRCVRPRSPNCGAVSPAIPRAG
jgi:uncharacterized protein YbjT (DUF2867 family)